jgi:hypothetical protein
VHTREAEAWYLLDGAMTYQTGPDLVRLEPGDFIYLPRNVPHAFRTTGTTASRFLALTLPGELLDIYDEVGRPAAERRLPDGGVPVEDIARWLELAPRYGLRVIGPPIPEGAQAPHSEHEKDTMMIVRSPADVESRRREAERLVREQFRIIETGELDLAEANITPDYTNHRFAHEPLAARGGGADALKATAVWLCRAFSELRFDVHEVVVVDDRAIAWVTLHGRNTGPFVVHDSPDGAVTGAFPPTGRAFAARQVHWFRIADGAIAEDDAVRDDMGTAKQVGWIPPRPGFVLRMIVTRRRERRAAAAPVAWKDQPLSPRDDVRCDEVQALRGEGSECCTSSASTRSASWWVTCTSWTRNRRRARTVRSTGSGSSCG